MSKIKLFLLGGIFTLFGIFNFSSAGSLSFQGDFVNHVYNPSEFYTDIPLKDYDWSTLSYVCNSTKQCGIGFRSSGGQYCNIVYSIKEGNVLYNNCLNFNYNGSFQVLSEKGNAGRDEFVSFFVSDGIFDMYDNGLTPAVEGVKTTVNQIIPLMVFIGIGVLVVTLGFIAIRWLVNWLGGKIRSVFKSKRG